jgi:hypothetical protein
LPYSPFFLTHIIKLSLSNANIELNQQFITAPIGTAGWPRSVESGRERLEFKPDIAHWDRSKTDHGHEKPKLAIKKS